MSLPPLWLTDAEVADATRLRQPAAQARFLRQIGVPFERRPDGTLLVIREAFNRALGGAGGGVPSGPKEAANGLKWGQHA